MPDYQALRGQAGSCGWYLRQSADYRYFVQVTHDLEVKSDENITVPGIRQHDAEKGCSG